MSAATSSTLPARRQKQPAPTYRLTPLLAHILLLMALGYSNREIGEEMYLSESTVKTYARRLFKALGARDRANAVHIAHLGGLLVPQQNSVPTIRVVKLTRMGVPSE